MSRFSSGPTDLPATEAEALAAEIVGLGCRISGLRYRLIRCLAHYDAVGSWALSGAVTCAHWAADALGVTVGTAREYLRVGHALERLVVIDAAFSSGVLSWAQVRMLSRIAVDHPDRQDELVALCRGVPAGRLGVTLARWTAQHEDPDERDRRHDRDTALWNRVEPDGMHVITMRLPPLAAGIIMAGIDATVMTGRTSAGGTTTRRTTTDGGDDVAAATSSARTVTDFGTRRRSLARQRADALVGLVSGGGAYVETEVILHIRAEGCTLDDGSPIEGSVVERVAPQAFLRVLIHDAESNPINASGRHRHPHARQKRVVKERDRHCRHPGCTSQAFLEYDHVPEFGTTHHTLVDELELRCAKHHRDRHRG